MPSPCCLSLCSTRLASTCRHWQAGCHHAVATRMNVQRRATVAVLRGHSSRSRRCTKVQRTAGPLLAGKRGLSPPASGERRLGSGRGTWASTRGSEISLKGPCKGQRQHFRFVLSGDSEALRRLQCCGRHAGRGRGRNVRCLQCYCVRRPCPSQGYCSEEQREEALVAKQLRTMGAELTTVWGGTLYMPEDTERYDSLMMVHGPFRFKFLVAFLAFWFAHPGSLRGSAGPQRWTSPRSGVEGPRVSSRIGTPKCARAWSALVEHEQEAMSGRSSE